MQIQFSEKELEDFLCKDKNLEKYLGLKFVARQVNISPVGIIDILAYDKKAKCWVIIELKKANLDIYAYVQGMSYLNFYKKTKSEIEVKGLSRKRDFALLLVGDNVDSSIHKVVKHYNFHDEWIISNETHYALFGVDFEKGIDFTYQNPTQIDFQDKINDISHLNELVRAGVL